MREVKFRAWSIEHEEYIEDVVHDGSSWLEAHGYDYVNVSEIFDGDEFIVEQYTSLKDKNGKEIYEGDIVKGGWLYGKDEHIVKYLDYGFYPFTITDFDGDPMIRNVDIEIIGNIHENPKILEDEEK